MASFQIARGANPGDAAGHRPGADADERWQESWALVWSDPRRRMGGTVHLGLARNLQTTDLWLAVIADGREMLKFQSLTLPIPTQDLPELDIGPVQVQAKDLRSAVVRAAHGDTSIELTYESFAEPVTFAVDHPGAAMGAGHYESFGRVEGMLRDGDDTVTVSGFAFQDHSWGPRDYRALLAFRNLAGTCGPDFSFQVFAAITPAGQAVRGYIQDGEQYHPITSASCGIRIADDGHTATSCDTRLWSHDRGWHLTGEVFGATVHTHRDGFFMTEGYASFEVGGRLGAGVIDVRELGAPAPWHRTQLALDGPSEGH